MNEKLSTVVNHRLFAPVTVGAISFGIGIVVGKWLGKRSNKKVAVHQLPDDLQLNLDAEKLEELREVITLSDGTEIYVKTEVDDDDDDSVITEDQKIAMMQVDENITISIQSVVGNDEEMVPIGFAADDDDWNYAEEVAKRTMDRPYIIHKDEFYGQERDYDQSTFIYYAGDDILADEENNPVYNYEQKVGELKFGHGSPHDPNVVHVRNDKLRSEYEICLDPGSYAVEVLGLEEEEAEARRDRDLRHSVRKFREE